MKTILRSVLSLALLIVTGCGRSGEAGSADGRPTIALVVKTLNNPFFIEMRRGAQEAADELGVRLIVQAAEREIDVERQMQIVENLIQRRVDALLITPSGSREIVPAVVKANRAAIPVFILDTRIDEGALRSAGGSIVAFIGSDNHAGGRLAGEFLRERTGGQARVAVLEGIAGHETGDARLRGFREALAGDAGMSIIASQPANWERDQGYNVFQNILQAHPGVTALFAASDLMALGALEAIAAAGASNRIAVVGFDAQPEAREAVRRGEMAATIAQNPALMGRIGIETAMAALAGEPVPAEVPVAIEVIR